MADYTILLPPSEGKAGGGDDDRSWLAIADDPTHNAFGQLNDVRLQVIHALQEALSQPQTALSKLFGVKDERLATAIATNADLPNGPLLPAIRRYTGVLFDYLDYEGMAPETRRAFDERTILFSGLWGLLRPGDLIPDYKLKINASLPEVGRLSTFWKPHISALLNPLLAGFVVWDLLPNAHSRAWDGKSEMAAHWQVKFVQRVEKKGETSYRTVSHWSKALKGALVRFICAHDVTDPDPFVDFQHPQGYRFSPEMSKRDERGGELIFVQK